MGMKCHPKWIKKDQIVSTKIKMDKKKEQIVSTRLKMDQKRPNCINKDQNGSKKNKLYPLRSKWINRITEIRIQNVISDGYKIFATAKSFLGNVEEF